MSETVPMLEISKLEPRQIGALIEAKLIEWNISYEYDPAVPVAELKKIQQAQVRDLEHQHDQETVEQYATFLKQGVTFPPIVLLRDDIVLDGNTRIAAAKQAGVKTLPAFKCQFANPDLARAFAGALNQMGGRRLSAGEARVQAEILMTFKFEDDAIARELGYGRTQVNNWRRDREVREHAERTQTTEIVEKITASNARKLAAIKQDLPFAAAASLIADTKLPAKQITELVRSIQESPSEAVALETIAQRRTEIVAAGPPPHRATLPPEIATARRLLPQFIKFAGRELALLESDPERRDGWVQQWMTVRDIAATVVAAHG